MEREQPRVDVERERCPYCHQAGAPGEEKVACDACMAWHHSTCWADHRRCSACGHAVFSGSTGGPLEQCGKASCMESALENVGEQRLCLKHALQHHRSTARLAYVVALVFLLLASALTYAISVGARSEPRLVAFAVVSFGCALVLLIHGGHSSKRTRRLVSLTPTAAPRKEEPGP